MPFRSLPIDSHLYERGRHFGDENFTRETLAAAGYLVHWRFPLLGVDGRPALAGGPAVVTWLSSHPQGLLRRDTQTVITVDHRQTIETEYCIIPTVRAREYPNFILLPAEAALLPGGDAAINAIYARFCILIRPTSTLQARAHWVPGTTGGYLDTPNKVDKDDAIARPRYIASQWRLNRRALILAHSIAPEQVVNGNPIHWRQLGQAGAWVVARVLQTTTPNALVQMCLSNRRLMLRDFIRAREMPIASMGGPLESSIITVGAAGGGTLYFRVLQEDLFRLDPDPLSAHRRGLMNWLRSWVFHENELPDCMRVLSPRRSIVRALGPGAPAAAMQLYFEIVGLGWRDPTGFLAAADVRESPRVSTVYMPRMHDIRHELHIWLSARGVQAPLRHPLGQRGDAVHAWARARSDTEHPSTALAYHPAMARMPRQAYRPPNSDSLLVYLPQMLDESLSR